MSTVGYTKRAGSFYKVFRTRKDHTSAQQTCEADGGHLAVVNTEALNNFIVDLISDPDDFWIGLNDNQVSRKLLIIQYIFMYIYIIYMGSLLHCNSSLKNYVSPYCYVN